MHFFNPPKQKQLRQKLRNDKPLAEILLWNILKRKQFHGLKFRRQHGIGPYVADFYCTEKRLAIELDGESHYYKDAQKHDEIRNNFFEENDIKILRILNREVYGNIEGVLTYLEDNIINHP